MKTETQASEQQCYNNGSQTKTTVKDNETPSIATDTTPTMSDDKRREIAKEALVEYIGNSPSPEHRLYRLKVAQMLMDYSEFQEHRLTFQDNHDHGAW